jgi:hypothetical protein
VLVSVHEGGPGGEPVAASGAGGIASSTEECLRARTLRKVPWMASLCVFILERAVYVHLTIRRGSWFGGCRRFGSARQVAVTASGCTTTRW